MRTIPPTTRAALRAGDFTGSRQPRARVTVQQGRVLNRNTKLGAFTSYLFGPTARPLELPNISTVEIDRSADSDVQTATITIWNVKPLALGEKPERGALDRPGYFTPHRGGVNPFSKSWGQTRNEWYGLLRPKNLVRIYQGYGWDTTVIPEADPHLLQDGVFVIDTVTPNSDGTLTITCSDTASLLQDEILAPPVVPSHSPVPGLSYPISFQSHEKVTVYPSENSRRVKLTYDDCSNTPYGFSAVDGHLGRYAFDDNPSSYWLSIGNGGPRLPFSFEWVQGRCHGSSVSAVEVQTKGSGYHMFISVMVDGVWQGHDRMEYDFDHPEVVPDNGANIPYVWSVAHSVADGATQRVTLPRTYHNVEKVRVTCTNLWNSGIGPYVYRAGIRLLRAYAPAAPKQVDDKQNNYQDYTDIVKILLAWCHHWWPSDAHQTLSDGTRVAITPRKTDPYIRSGRIWGDLSSTATYGPDPIPQSVWDKVSVLDAITYVRNIVSFLFYVGEDGGVVWRPPNVYRLGNLDPVTHRRVQKFVRFTDEDSITELSTVLSGKDDRDIWAIGNADGNKFGAVRGIVDNDIGLRRVGIWSDQHFASDAEATVMASLIAVRAMFLARTDSFTVPANQQVQIDDQIQLVERVTSEGYYHYVSGIKSNLDMGTGEWTYQISTHWLGLDPHGEWAFDVTKLPRDTREYLNLMHALNGVSS